MGGWKGEETSWRTMNSGGRQLPSPGNVLLPLPPPHRQALSRYAVVSYVGSPRHGRSSRVIVFVADDHGSRCRIFT